MLCDERPAFSMAKWEIGGRLEGTFGLQVQSETSARFCGSDEHETVLIV